MNDFLVHRYWCNLDRPIPARTIYPYIIRPYRADTDSRPVHALIEDAYTDSGRLAALHAWLRALSSPGEFDPGLAFVIETPIGTMVAAGIAGSAGLVKDIAVARAFRRQGLGTMLLSHICQAFQRRGLRSIYLNVRADNHAAIALYEGLAWRCVESAAA